MEPSSRIHRVRVSILYREYWIHDLCLSFTPAFATNPHDSDQIVPIFEQAVQVRKDQTETVLLVRKDRLLP